jgi:hypothetical protein
MGFCSGLVELRGEDSLELFIRKSGDKEWLPVEGVTDTEANRRAIARAFNAAGCSVKVLD